MVSTLAGTSQFSLASSDETGCRWSDYCAMGGVPYLAADNDTRVNLLMLAAGMRNLPVALSSLPQDISRSRGYQFGVFPGEAAPVTDQTTTPGQTAVPQEDPLDALALSLGIKPSGLTGFSAEYEGRWISNNPLSLSQFFQTLLDDQQLDQAERDLLALRRPKFTG
ncbi:Uncharacterised protein [Serratia fonticola]|uniref:Uncharacterized protein n=1 Tax=Serratia fonticola TaxID=47917 RepID=A0A4U9W615_SERFO|nr:Uncharacterised protein [Serratia fonticola]